MRAYSIDLRERVLMDWDRSRGWIAIVCIRGTEAASAATSLGFFFEPDPSSFRSLSRCLAKTYLRMSNIAPVRTSDSECGSRLPARSFIFFWLRALLRYPSPVAFTRC